MTRVLLFALSARAGDAPPPPITGGSPTADFQNVGVLAGHFADTGEWFAFCSGELISPSWVLTAAHCAHMFDEFEAKTAFEFAFFLGEDFYLRTGTIADAPVAEWYAHPDYDGDAAAHDVGLLHLATSIDTVDVLPINANPIDAAWKAQTITFVGFGVTTNDEQGAGTKRTVDVDIKKFDETAVYTYTPGTNTCPGDSGGAMLIRDAAGSWELVGVISQGYNKGIGPVECESGGAVTARADIDLAWIEQHATIVRGGDNYVDDTGTASDEPGGNVIADLDQGKASGCGATSGRCSVAAAVLALFVTLGRRRHRLCGVGTDVA